MSRIPCFHSCLLRETHDRRAHVNRTRQSEGEGARVHYRARRGGRTSIGETGAHACVEPNRARVHYCAGVFHRSLILRQGKLYRLCFCRVRGQCVRLCTSPPALPPPMYRKHFRRGAEMHGVSLLSCFVLRSLSLSFSLFPSHSLFSIFFCFCFSSTKTSHVSNPN